MNSPVKSTKRLQFFTPKKTGTLAAIIIAAAILVWPVYVNFGQKVNQLRVDELGETSVLSVETGGYGWKGSRAEYIVGRLIPFNSWAGPPGHAYHSSSHHVYVIENGSLSKVMSDKHSGGVEMISYKNRLCRVIRLTPSLDEVPKVEVWGSDKFLAHPSNLKWSEWMKNDTNQVKTKFPDLDGFIHIKFGDDTLEISEVRDLRRVEAQFQDRKQIVFQGKEAGVISRTEFWQMFTRSGVLK